MSALVESVLGLRLVDPGWLLLLLAVPVAWWIGARGRRPSVVFAPAMFTTALTNDGGSAPRSWRVRLLPLPRLLQIAGLVVLAVALARPVQRDELPLKTQGIDIVLCLDLSSSMEAKDMDPARSRLAIAKSAAAEFVKGRPDDRIGLVCFARFPDLRCPLTLDHRALLEFLAEVRLVDKEGPEDATGIGTALARSTQVLRGSAAPSKVVILLTDGEENVATADTPEEIAPVHAAQLMAELGVRAYTISAGRLTTDAEGSAVPIDTPQIELVASKTGGRFFSAQDATAVADRYAAIDKLETAEFDEPRFKIEERYLGFLLAGMLLMLLSRLVSSTVLGVLP